MRRRSRRGGVSQMLGVILLIALALLGAGVVTTMFSNIYTGVSGSVNVTSEGSIISVNAATGGGMLLIVINNKGPGTVNLRKVEIFTATGGNVTVTPTSSTAASFTGGVTGTGTIVGGVGVGYLTSGSVSYLVIPQGQSASFRLNVSSGLASLFPPNQNFLMLLTPYGGSVVRLSIQSVNQ